MNKLKFLKSTSVLLFILFSISATFAAEKNITYMQILQKPNDLDLNFPKMEFRQTVIVCGIGMFVLGMIGFVVLALMDNALPVFFNWLTGS